jgi:alpha-beta hydrolase superfamily lysophospholipase
MTAPHFAADRLEYLVSPAGALRLATYEWHPRGPTPPGVSVSDARPRAVIVLAHGYGEHAGRHAARPIGELMRNGYLVAALDHRGHGRSDGPRATCERFDDFTDDYAALVGRTRARYPDAPTTPSGTRWGASSPCATP